MRPTYAIAAALLVLGGCANWKGDYTPIAFEDADKGAFYVSKVEVGVSEYIESETLEEEFLEVLQDELTEDLPEPTGAPAQLAIKLTHFSDSYLMQLMATTVLTDAETNRVIGTASLNTAPGRDGPYTDSGSTGSVLGELIKLGVIAATTDLESDSSSELVKMIRERLLIPNGVGVRLEIPIASE